jgi:hypothetical protein
MAIILFVILCFLDPITPGTGMEKERPVIRSVSRLGCLNQTTNGDWTGLDHHPFQPDPQLQSEPIWMWPVAGFPDLGTSDQPAQTG